MASTSATFYLNADQDTTLGEESWTDVDNALSQGPLASCVLPYDGGAAQYTGMILLYEADWAEDVPSDATIDGIEITVRARKGALAVDDVDFYFLQLSKNAGVSATGNNKAAGTLTTSLANTFTFGGASDLWGTTWTPLQINAAGFAVRLQFDAQTNTEQNYVYVDWIKATVHYTPSSVTGNASVASATANAAASNVILTTPASDSVTASAASYSSTVLIAGEVQADAFAAQATATTGASSAIVCVTATAAAATASVGESTARALIFGFALKASATASVGESSVPTIAPRRVENLKAIRSPYTAVTLEWDAVAGAASYQVLQADARRASFAEVATPTSNTQAIDPLTETDNFNFKVRAVSSTGDKGPSSSVVFTKGKNTTL